MYDAKLAKEIADYIDQVAAQGTRISLEDLEGRPLPIRLRDGIIKLFSSYL